MNTPAVEKCREQKKRDHKDAYPMQNNKLQRVLCHSQDSGHRRRAPMVANAPKYTTFVPAVRCLEFFNHRSHSQTQQCDVIPIVPCPLSLTSSPVCAPNGRIHRHRCREQGRVSCPAFRSVSGRPSDIVVCVCKQVVVARRRLLAAESRSEAPCSRSPITCD